MNKKLAYTTAMSSESDGGAHIGAVVLAAGDSNRMQGIDKIFYPLGGAPLVWHSIATFLAHPMIEDIVLVTSASNMGRAVEVIAENGAGGVVKVCEGGERRQDSVNRGLRLLDDCEYIVVHDGARPFVSEDMIDRGIAESKECGAAIAAVPVKDTIKMSNKIPDGEHTVAQTLPRDRLWAVQTPQIFRATLLAEAHRRVSHMVTDDASMIEAIGNPVRLFHGSYYNIKVTTPEDLLFANAIVAGGLSNIDRTVNTVSAAQSGSGE
ncbi:MAG: 2-C-methyl-D-erythritol 4-phosphate cytidylyltransferase [Chloroflexi bacterium]|nr:2-C-methyl-D-erythritol 4-phosphate cytidylyltransferase [Chloroflexota bacterium]